MCVNEYRIDGLREERRGGGDGERGKRDADV